MIGLRLLNQDTFLPFDSRAKLLLGTRSPLRPSHVDTCFAMCYSRSCSVLRTCHR